MSTNFEDLIGRGATGSKPAAGVPGRLYYDTTLEQLERDTGVAWEVCEPGSGGGGAPTDYPYWGFGANGDLSAEVNVLAMHLANEFRNFPTYTPIDLDLAALNLWYDSIGTPTTAPTMVDVAGEGGITETWEYAIKCVADAANEGWEQRYTYADEHRIKAGKYLSGLFAIWVVTNGRTVTATFRNSTGETTTATATAQDWTTVEVPGHLLAGTYVDVEFTVDGADTFYVVPLGLNIGMRGVPLRPRSTRYVDKTEANVVNGVDPGGADFTDVNIQANTSKLAVAFQCAGRYKNTTAGDNFLRCRRNGDTTDGSGQIVCVAPSTTITGAGMKIVPLDDQQIFEYKTAAAAGSAETVNIGVNGYWEWE